MSSKKNKSTKDLPNNSTKKTISKIENTVSFFDTLNNKAIYIALGIIAIIAFLVFKDFLLHKKIYLFKDIGSDTITFHQPYLYHIASYFHENGFISWSFKMGMGQSLFPLFLKDYFDLLIYALGTDYINYLFGFKEFLKIIIGGVLFFFFIKKLGLSNFTRITGSVLFSFTAFMIVGGGWTVFSAEAVNLALMLLGFELLYQNNKGYVFALAAFIFALSMPFNLYLYGAFVGTYATLRFITDQSNETSFSLKALFPFYTKIVLFAITGALLAGPFLLENINQMLESPRGSGEFSYFNQLIGLPMFELADKFEFGTCMMRFFSSDLIGSGLDFKGWQNTLEAPLFYCGIICLVLLPQLFIFLDKKQKLYFGLFVFIWLMPIIFPYFRRAFWLFTGDYYRTYSFFVSLTFLILSLFAIDKIVKEKKINLIVLISTITVWFILLSYPYFESRSPVISSISLTVKVLLITYGIFLYLIANASNKYILPALLAVICFESYYMSNMSVNKRVHMYTSELKEKVGYNDYSLDAIEYLNSIDTSFYRVDKNYFSSPAVHMGLNDAMIQGYFGTSCYNGFSQKSYVDYLKNYNIIGNNENEARWAMGLNNRIILESINSVKYLLLKNNSNPAIKMSHDSLNTFGDIVLMRNKFFLPLGFCYNSFFRQSDFVRLNPFQKDIISLNALIIKDENMQKVNVFKALSIQDTSLALNFTWDTYGDMINTLKRDTLTITKFSQTNIEGNLTINENKLFYLSIPYDKGWTIKVNGKTTEPILASNGMMSLILEKGNNEIKLIFAHKYISKGIILSICSLICLLGLVFFYNNNKS